MPNHLAGPTPLPLGEDGLLPPSTVGELVMSPAYLVFVQQTNARMDVAAWDRHAAQFWGTRVAFTRPKRYGDAFPEVDGAHVVLTTEGDAPLMRTVLVRPRADSDLEDVRKATAGGGIRELASRCQTVALVLVEPDATDRGALRVAAILSSVLLGPILSPDKTSLFGARSARDMLERR